MRLLTLKIDNSKYHFVNFEGNNSPQQKYIFNKEAEEANIIRFYPFDNRNVRNGVTLQINREKSQCYIAGIELTGGQPAEGQPEHLCVKITLSAERPKNSQNVIPINDTDRLSISDNGQISLLIDIDSPYSIISVEVIYGRITREFTLIYANRARVADAVLDYGSEASQLLVGSRERETELSNILNLFNEFKYENILGRGLFGETSSSDFAQYSENNEKLFLSKFMVGKTIDLRLLNDDHREVKLEEFFKFIFKRGDIDSLKQNYIVLPNTKIMDSGNCDIDINIIENSGEEGAPVSLQELGDDLCHRMSVNVFLYQALVQVRQNNLGSRDRFVEFISFSILMPNSYSYKDISRNLKYLRIDIQQILDVFPERFGFIKGFEVSAVSESDASLIGASEISNERNVNNQYQFNNGKYLILDAGKGTFDFSIMEYKRGERFQNLCKSGIIGAGNAISYALLLDIIDGIIVREGDTEARHLRIQTFINEMILGNSIKGKAEGGGDPSNLLSLMNLIDEYKKAGRRVGCNQPTRVNVDELNIEGVINTIKREFTGEEVKRRLATHPFTDMMIKKIVDSVFDQIEKVNVYRDENGAADNNINYYVCAGRGFLYEPLKAAIDRKITERFPECREVTYLGNNNTATPKNVCLLISNVINRGRYNSNVIGIPFIINDPPVKERGEEQTSAQSSNKGFFGHLWQQIKQLRDKEESVDVRGVVTPTYQTYNHDGSEEGVDPMVDGYHFKNTNNSVSRVNIGGAEFGLARSIPKNCDIYVFYNGEGYTIRCNGELYAIDPGINAEGQLAFESLFPSVKCYPQNYTPFFNANDFDTEEDDVIESIAMPTPQNQIFDRGESESVAKSKPDSTAADAPQSPEPDSDKGDGDDSKNTPFDMDILLGDIEEQNSKLKQ